MNSNASIDALELMLTDLRTRNEPIRHKAAFRGCQPEFQSLVSRLIEQLETELMDAKQRERLQKRDLDLSRVLIYSGRLPPSPLSPSTSVSAWR